MTPRQRRPQSSTHFDALLALMEPWPKSWAGIAKDEAVGRDLTDLMRPFLAHLHQHNLSAKTLRRHLDNLWLIGGEVIRQLHDDSALRKKDSRTLLLDAIYDGEAPLIGDFTEAQQRSLDSTARKLFHFLFAPTGPS
jgi:hypothetical protein